MTCQEDKLTAEEVERGVEAVADAVNEAVSTDKDARRVFWRDDERECASVQIDQALNWVNAALALATTVALARLLGNQDSDGAWAALAAIGALASIVTVAVLRNWALLALKVALFATPANLLTALPLAVTGLTYVAAVMRRDMRRRSWALTGVLVALLLLTVWKAGQSMVAAVRPSPMSAYLSTLGNTLNRGATRANIRRVLADDE